MKDTFCRDCYHCKTERKNEQGKVRCVKLHKFVDLKDRSCESFGSEFTDMVREKIQRMSEVIQNDKR